MFARCCAALATRASRLDFSASTAFMASMRIHFSCSRRCSMRLWGSSQPSLNCSGALLMNSSSEMRPISSSVYLDLHSTGPGQYMLHRVMLSVAADCIDSKCSDMPRQVRTVLHDATAYILMPDSCLYTICL